MSDPAEGRVLSDHSASREFEDGSPDIISSLRAENERLRGLLQSIFGAADHSDAALYDATKHAEAELARAVDEGEAQ